MTGLKKVSLNPSSTFSHSTRIERMKVVLSYILTAKLQNSYKKSSAESTLWARHATSAAATFSQRATTHCRLCLVGSSDIGFIRLVSWPLRRDAQCGMRFLLGFSVVLNADN